MAKMLIPRQLFFALKGFNLAALFYFLIIALYLARKIGYLFYLILKAKLAGFFKKKLAIYYLYNFITTVSL